MIKLEYTPSTRVGYRHRTWTRIGESAHKVSSLQNQFALSEYEHSEEEALQLFRVWLWHELQDTFNVVSTEMRRLARAHKRDEAVEVLVPKAAPHGALIVRALLWLVDNADLREPVQTRWTEPGPTYEPILPDGVITTKSEIDPKYIVWIEGNTQCRIGVVVEYGKALVPAYGIVPLKNFRWVKRTLAQSKKVQQYVADALDMAFIEEADATPVEYDPAPDYDTKARFEESDIWAQTGEETWWNEAAQGLTNFDAVAVVEQLYDEVDDVTAALEIADLPEVEEWFWKRPPDPSPYQLATIKPVYKYTGEQGPLMVKSAKEQVEGAKFRYATKAETTAYMEKFRQGNK